MGRGDGRYLVVSRKIELAQLVQELLSLGESPKYRVIPPTILTKTNNEGES